MASVHGRKGSVEFAGVSPGTILNISSFSLEEEIEAHEDTGLSTTNPTEKTYNFDGLRGLKGTIEFVSDIHLLPPQAGDTFSATLSTDANTNYFGVFGITRMSLKVDRSDLQRITAEVMSTGTVTRTEQE